MDSTPEVPYTLDQIEESLYYTALAGRFLQPLVSFFRQMKLEWGNTPTAHAQLRYRKPVIVLGKKFFAEQVATKEEGAQVLLHEIMHHLFLHLLIEDQIKEKDYSPDVVNIAMDAIINAYLHKVGAASFMKRFYKDEGFYSFLRPDSTFPELEQTQEGRALKGEFQQFYRELHQLNVTLEQSLEFFHKHFPKPKITVALIGGPQNDGDKKDGDKEEGQSGGAQPGGEQPDGGGIRIEIEVPGGMPKPGQGGKRGRKRESPIFSKGQAEECLSAIAGKVIAVLSRDNFAKVIRKVTEVATRPGSARLARRFSRKMPAKFLRSDLLIAEMDRTLYTAADYRQRKVTIFIDVSGSVTEYLPFIVGLMQSLSLAEFQVTSVVWADRAEEISFAALREGEIPTSVGGGTQGECVATYIDQRRIQQAVIITDNAAGSLHTPIKGKVQLCLFDGASSLSGSFLDKTMVPRCTTHQLKLK